MKLALKIKLLTDAAQAASVHGVMQAVCRHVLFALLCLTVCSPATAQTLSITHSFTSELAYTDGSVPYAALIQGSDGNFYGTTKFGGTNGDGTVFKVTPDGTETVLHDFSDGTVPNDGISPVAALAEGPDGDFYGTTNNGGANGYGTVFKITPSGAETVLHGFATPGPSNDGFYPQATMTLGNDGNFYGVTRSGGSADKGTIFKITPAGAETILHNFGDGSLPNDGSDPYNALLLGRDGSLYGTTGNGGSAGDGMVFKITTKGAMSVIYSFQGTPNDGIEPTALTIGPDGDFYGTTGGGGAVGDGTVFKITPSGAETIIYSFQTGAGSAGNAPSSLTVGADGDFYGTTLTGGSKLAGSVFKITPSGTETTLHSFQDGTVKNDGYLAYGPLLLGTDGNLYGTASIGGAGNKGTVFTVSPNGTVTTLYSFQLTTLPDDGATPSSGLVSGADGNFYGTTPSGGSANRGAVFKITPTGSETILHDFGDGTIPNDGISPQTSLLLGSDGNFYGTTAQGGSVNHGTVFKITPSGTETILHNFGDGTVPNDGAGPIAALILGSDGNYYGTTSGGGAGGGGVGNQGTIFRITPAGSVTILHDFGNTLTPHDGTNPSSALVLGDDGNFYGTTPYGGTTANAVPYGVGDGVVFKITPSGTETILHVFADGSVPGDGSKPEAALAAGADGDFYGTTEFGGSASLGTVFKVTPGGTETVLHSFGDGSVPNDGIVPLASLVLNRDGDFYGTTSESSVAGGGTIFKITMDGSESVLHVFNDGSVPNDGSDPIAALVPGNDGGLYGTTQYGGSTVGMGFMGMGDGTVFRLIPSTVPIWTSKDVAAASDGTARILWTRSDGAAGVWSLSAANLQTSVGPTYGPYSDTHGTWAAKSVKAASNGTGRMLWTRSDGAAGVWVLSSAGVQTGVGPTYGPYPGWTATDLAVASDGTSRVLWTNTNGMAGVWTFNAAGTETIIGKTYGPFSGWTAKAVGAAGDGTARVLWTNTNGDAGVWTFNASDVNTVIGKTYGPYTGWSAKGLGTSSDGTSRVLWTNTNGEAGVWTFSAADIETTIGPTYGPYPGYTAAALDAANDQSRVLWVNSTRAAGLWTFGANDAQSVIGATYGPF